MLRLATFTAIEERSPDADYWVRKRWTPRVPIPFTLDAPVLIESVLSSLANDAPIPIEILHEYPPSLARVSQTVMEALLAGQQSNARASQTVMEALLAGEIANARASQTVMEVLLVTAAVPPVCAGIYPDLPGLTWSVIREVLQPMRIQRAVAGNEWRGLDYAWPLRRWTLSYNFLRDQWPSDLGAPQYELQTLLGFIGWAKGAGSCFCFLDPEDSEAVNEPMLILNSWAPAVGDGLQESFQLARSVLPGGALEPIRAVYQVDTVYINGVPTTAYNWAPATGILTFSQPPPIGTALTADFSYYWRVRFVEDGLPMEQFMFRLWRQGKVQLVECIP